MAKLTRTQKYAQLRENLANDPEPSLTTKDLSQYQNKLNNITARSENVKPADDDITWVDYPDLMSVDELVDSFIKENKQSMEKAPEPIVAEPQPPIDSHFEDRISEVIEDVSLDHIYSTPHVSEPVKEPVPIVEEKKEIAELEEKPESPFMGYYHNPNLEPVRQETVKPQLEEVPHPQMPRQDYTELGQNLEPADHHVVDHTETAANSLISEVIDEVDQHIKASGEQDIAQITNEIVDEVRHTERPAYARQDEDEYSNTVSMEISKIMDEMVEAEPVRPIVQEPVIEEPLPVIEEPTPVVEEHPVLAKALEEEKEDIVEIKNIDEIDIEPRPVKEAPTGTIPFIVSATDDEDLIEDEEEGSNTILNIILVILIIILLAVLGLIIFYILKTKGII